MLIILRNKHPLVTVNTMLDLFFYSAKMHQISTKMTENENICLAFYWVISCSMSEMALYYFKSLFITP